LLEPGSGATTCWSHNPLGEGIRQTDAPGNVQAFFHTVAGQLKACALQLKDQPEQEVLVSDIRYDAQGRVESETAGNGVITTAQYRAEDGRLIQLQATRSGGQFLQDLNYDYDPVGNVIRIEDRAQPTRHFANQRIEPVSTYRYDTLYQLIEATGREAAMVNHGPIFPDFLSPVDPSQLANYTQTYTYDAAGNLQQLTHVGAQHHSWALVTARTSNRSLPVVNDQPPGEEDIAAAFDANGNLRALQAGQTLSWDRRNQLQCVRPVIRESSDDDSERYIYDTSGQRLRKLRSTQAKTVAHTAEVRYLPGLEIRTDTATGETLHVITTQAGRNGVRVLHWQSEESQGLANDQIRYSLADHLGSSTLELDSAAQVISHESYYPFGGTSWWAGRSAIEAHYKTVRYSGKERDATGLYYYGLRYYAPWLQRWINPDPAGVVDGLNMFCFVRNSPLRFGDSEGAAPYDVLGEHEMSVRVKYGLENVARGLSEFNSQQKAAMLEGIDVADRLLKSAVAELSKEIPGKGVAKMIKATFGEVDQEQEGKIVKYLKSAFERQREYITSLAGDAGWKISLFIAQGIEGIAYKKSAHTPERTIALSVDIVENHHVLVLARGLIHESSHATADTVDLYYNPISALEVYAGDEQIKSWSEEIRGALRTLSTQGLNTVAINLEHHSNVMHLASGHSISPEQYDSEFVSDPFTRALVLLSNADTYSSFIMGTKLPARVMSRKNAKAARSSGFTTGREVF